MNIRSRIAAQATWATDNTLGRARAIIRTDQAYFFRPLMTADAVCNVTLKVKIMHDTYGRFRMAINPPQIVTGSY